MTEPEAEEEKRPSQVEVFVDFVESWFDQRKARQKPKAKAAPAPKKDEKSDVEAGNADGESKEKKDAGILDVDGDGDVDMDDMLAAMEGDVEGEAVDTLEHMKTHRPVFITSQLVICVIFWLVGAGYSAATEEQVDFLMSQGGLETFAKGWTAVRVHEDCKDLRWQVWRLLTYQWTHGHFTHIAMNTLVTIFTGLPLEGFHGKWRTMVIFETSVIAGGLWHMAWRPHDSGLVGMSAGCYALMAMHMADVIMNWKQHRWRIPRVILLLMLIGLDVGASLIAEPDDVTGHAAHFGGYLAGLIFGVHFVRNVKVTKCEQVLKAAFLFVGVACLIFCIVWISFWAPRAMWDGMVPWCWARQAFSYPYFGDREWHCIRCPDEICIADFTAKLETSLSPVSYIACDQGGLWWT